MSSDAPPSGSGGAEAAQDDPAPSKPGQPPEEYRGAYVNINNQEYGDWGSIQTDEKGYFEIMVRPGCASINVWADGYYSWEDCVDLVNLADNEYSVKIYMKPRPQPDCIIYGTVTNKSSGKPIANAYASAWNEETYGYGNAQTDESGRYEIKVIHGWNHVSIWGDGYFSYSATADLPANEKTQKDIPMKAGAYYYRGQDYSDGGAAKVGAPMAAEQASSDSMQNSMRQNSLASGASGGYALDQNVKVDIKGEGIGGLPGFEVLALVGAIGAALVLGRRRK